MDRVVPLPRPSGPPPCPAALRERWRSATLAAGWPFPSDWAVPGVDAVCEAAADGRDPRPALDRLGRDRAESGAGLDETLHDLAALYAVARSSGLTFTGVVGVNGSGSVDREQPAADVVPSRLVRATALGWADAASGEIASTQVVDELTGLATLGYLRTRLGEVYRSAQADGRSVDDRHVLVLLALDLSRTSGLTRVVPMLLAAEAMRTVFCGGETLARVGPSVAAILCRRDELLPMRTRLLRQLATELLVADQDAAGAGPPRVWRERLPTTYQGACELLANLGR